MHRMRDENLVQIAEFVKNVKERWFKISLTETNMHNRR